MNARMLSHFSHVHLFTTLWIVALHAPLSMGFPRQEYLSGLPCFPPGDLPDPGIKPAAPDLQEDSLPLTTGKTLTRKAERFYTWSHSEEGGVKTEKRALKTLVMNN